ncbi:MAG: hypothetical protein H7Y10_12175 [Flavobacterium sp.]|nr:hypothetical protein [Flavobacterium sp.]
MAKKRNKYISEAFKALGYIEDDNSMLNTIDDIEHEIKEAKRGISEMEDVIEQAKELIKNHEENINFLTALKDQTEIEEFRAMNPKAKAIYKF